jgi:prepilin-type N-terminal cleavage/methylation domain-containing protein
MELKRGKWTPKGFTLVELMVVVAVVGILSTVAIPLYKQYQIKSRSSETKFILSALYTAEQSWFAEHGFFVSCVDELEMQPPPEHFSTYGFTNVATAFGNCAVTLHSPVILGTKAVNHTSAPTFSMFSNQFSGVALISGDGQAFTAGAMGFFGDDEATAQIQSLLFPSAHAMSSIGDTYIPHVDYVGGTINNLKDYSSYGGRVPANLN